MQGYWSSPRTGFAGFRQADISFTVFFMTISISPTPSLCETPRMIGTSLAYFEKNMSVGRYRTSSNDSHPGESCLSCLVIFGLKFRRTMLEPWQRAELGKRPWTFVCAPFALHGLSTVILRSGLHTTSAQRSLRIVAEPNGREASQYFKRPKPTSLQHST